MEFRKINAIFRPQRLAAVEERLRSLGVPGLSVTKVKGYGEYANFFTQDWLCTHVRVEIFTSEAEASKIAEAIMEVAYTGVQGDGIVAVLPVESVYHIRRQEQCHSKVCD